MPRKDHRQRRLILTALHGTGNATIRQLATALGPEWLTPSKLAALRQMLLTMWREGLVVRLGAGVFRGLRWGGSDSPDEIVRQIASLLKESGSACTLDIQEALTDHNVWGPDERDDRHRRILQTLVASGRFRCVGGDQWSITD